MNNIKKYALVFLLLLSTPTLANTTGYAWSESVGWFDFSRTVVTNTNLTGYAYNDNTGWLVMDSVTNTNGQLGGYAWSESVGWFDFSRASISNGNIIGYAYNDNTGWLSFATGTSVTTTWSIPVTPTPTPPPASSGPSYGGGSGGGSSSGGFSSIPASLKTPTTSPQVNTPTTTPNITVPNQSTPNPQTITQLVNTPRNLRLRSNSNDVRLLQQFLNQQGFTVSTRGNGSIGNESTFFGSLTRQALARFQKANNIRPATGYFGPITKAFIKTLTTNQ